MPKWIEERDAARARGIAAFETAIREVPEFATAMQALSDVIVTELDGTERQNSAHMAAYHEFLNYLTNMNAFSVLGDK